MSEMRERTNQRTEVDAEKTHQRKNQRMAGTTRKIGRLVIT